MLHGSGAIARMYRGDFGKVAVPWWATLSLRTNLIPWLLAALVDLGIVLENLQFCHGPLTCGLYAEGSVSAASFLERMKCDVDMYHQLKLQSGLSDTNKTCSSHVMLQV